jgi:alpha-L-fucosidase 2
MLLQSQDGAIHVLPALPDVWEAGSISGLKARGGFELDFSWKDNTVDQITVRSTLGGNCRIRSYVPLKGNGIVPAVGKNPNSFYHIPTINKPVFSKQAKITRLTTRKVFEYDIQTIKGKTYTFVRK